RNPGTLRRWVRESDSRASASQKSGNSSRWSFLKKSLLRSHPIVIGVIVTVVGGLILLYFQLVIDAHGSHPKLVVDQVNITSSGTVGSRQVLSKVEPLKIDIKLLNTGRQVAAVNDVRLVVEQFV